MGNRDFWTRLGTTVFVVNAPLAIAVVAGSMSLVIGVALSAVFGVALLVTWDGARTPTSAAAEPVDSAAPAASAPVVVSGAEMRQADRTVARLRSEQSR